MQLPILLLLIILLLLLLTDISREKETVSQEN
jgi:hypothetical protein